jgi:hypothetical protein
MYFGLVLSMMRNEKWETSDRLVAWSESREILEQFVERERVDPWIDENHAMANLNGTYRYNKSFRKDGPLEWYNPMSADGGEYIRPLESPSEYALRVVAGFPPHLLEEGYGGDRMKLYQAAFDFRQTLFDSNIKLG